MERFIFVSCCIVMALTIHPSVAESGEGAEKSKEGIWDKISDIIVGDSKESTEKKTIKNEHVMITKHTSSPEQLATNFLATNGVNHQVPDDFNTESRSSEENRKTHGPVHNNGFIDHSELHGFEKVGVKDRINVYENHYIPKDNSESISIEGGVSGRRLNHNRAYNSGYVHDEHHIIHQTPISYGYDRPNSNSDYIPTNDLRSESRSIEGGVSGRPLTRLNHNRAYNSGYVHDEHHPIHQTPTSYGYDHPNSNSHYIQKDDSRTESTSSEEAKVEKIPVNLDHNNGYNSGYVHDEHHPIHQTPTSYGYDHPNSNSHYIQKDDSRTESTSSEEAKVEKIPVNLDHNNGYNSGYVHDEHHPIHQTPTSYGYDHPNSNSHYIQKDDSRFESTSSEEAKVEKIPVNLDHNNGYNYGVH